LPNTVTPDEVVGFELTRRFRTLQVLLKPKGDEPAQVLINALVGENGAGMLRFGAGSVHDLVSGVTLTPDDLESEIGGPYVTEFSATTVDPSGGQGEDLSTGFSQGVPFQLPTASYAIPALQIKPHLKLADLLKIERALQHVVRNSLSYSRAVWMSMTPEERAVMLESYTIGVGPGGSTDADGFIPLLNCVANTVLGFYGNSMVMPFSLPPIVIKVQGDESPLTTKDIQSFLKRFHQEDFLSPESHIALPTNGVLCEAVLGQCPSAEKIDLTRFWNWADSTIPQATDIGAVDAERAPLLNKDLIAGPSVLTNPTPMIANITGGSAPGDSGIDLLKALIAKGPSATDFTSPDSSGKLYDLGAKTLSAAEDARKNALGTAQQLSTDVMKMLPDLLKANSASSQAAKQDSAASDAARQKKQGDGAKKLKESAPNLLKAANMQPDQPSANLFANNVVSGIFGDDGLPLDLASDLLPAFTEADDAETLTQGSSAFLAALGLLTA
jgi:hypothetical protein